MPAVVMPRLGDGMEEGTLVRWLKAEGDAVAADEPLAEIETDKATAELPAETAGTLARLLVDEGAIVPVGEPIAVILGPGEWDEDGPPATDGKDARRHGLPAVVPPRPAPRPSAQVARSEAGGAVRASPAARQLARERGVDLHQLRGSGPNGRVVRADVEALVGPIAPPRPATADGAVGAGPPSPSSPAPAPLPAVAGPTGAGGVEIAAGRRRPSVGWAVSGEAGASAIADGEPGTPTSPPAYPAQASDELEPLTRMRQAIARRMATAKREMPHYYVAVSVDMSEALRVRRELNAQLPEGDHIPISPMIVRACAIALEHHPHFNATFTDQGITVHHDINIGLAVALDDGLVVPAILDCRGKSLGAVAREARDAAERARGGRLRPAELNDGTFTVSNLGMYGVETLIAIIQPGQAAILGVGNVEDRPVVRDGQIVARSIMTIALSADHRVTDGAEGAKFIAEIKELLENPARLVL